MPCQSPSHARPRHRLLHSSPGQLRLLSGRATRCHYIDNTGRESFAYLMIGERIPGDEVTYLEDAT
jgi:hypothetical protein